MGSDPVQSTILHAQSHDSSAATVLIHDQIQGKVLNCSKAKLHQDWHQDCQSYREVRLNGGSGEFREMFTSSRTQQPVLMLQQLRPAKWGGDQQ